MKHTIEYNGERRTVEAKRTATINDVLEVAFPNLTWPIDYTKVVPVATGKRGAMLCILGPYHTVCGCPSCARERAK